MTVRRILNGDIATSGTQFVSEAQEIAQTVETNLTLFFGEYFRDTSIGVPWFQSILVKGGSQTTKDAIIKNEISKTDGVNSIASFSTDFDDISRTYTISAGIITPYGSATVSIDGVV